LFYEVAYPQPEPGQKQISALVVLNPAESRRLLAKATVALSSDAVSPMLSSVKSSSVSR